MNACNDILFVVEGKDIGAVLLFNILCQLIIGGAQEAGGKNAVPDHGIEHIFGPYGKGVSAKYLLGVIIEI